MGPEKMTAAAICLDGEPIAKIETVGGVLQITLPEITVPEGTPIAGPSMMTILAPEALELSLKLPKSWRCRSRKRFIKLLMDVGCDRNTASEMAKAVQRFSGRKSYQTALFDAMFLFTAYHAGE